MKPTVDAAAAALDQLAATIQASIPDDRPMYQIWGWQWPILSRTELAKMPTGVAARLRALADAEVGTSLEAVLAQVPQRTESIRSQGLPNMANVRIADPVVHQVEQLCRLISDELPPTPAVVTMDWKEVAKKEELPPELLRRLRSVEASLRAIEPRAQNLDEKIAVIEGAHAAAENLPTDMATLQEAREVIEAAREKAAQTEKAAAELSAKIVAYEAEAAKLVENCGEAYRATTTKGLAAAFAQKAMTLNISMLAWIAGLVGALGLGAYLALRRLETIETSLSSDISMEKIWVQVALAVFSVGAPIWFSWVATKQISQRFKLAEDYAFKASVAKAYEGYRREAARLDPEMEARLFGSALSRLDEAPIRLVDEENYGSPWHELVSSDAFKQALQAVPALQERLATLLPRK